MVEHIKLYNDAILVTVPKTSSSAMFTFTISDRSFCRIVKKYLALRPKKVNTKRFFLKYQGGKCKAFPIGKSTFCEMPRRIADYLKLPEAERHYSGTLFLTIM